MQPSSLISDLNAVQLSFFSSFPQPMPTPFILPALLQPSVQLHSTLPNTDSLLILLAQAQNASLALTFLSSVSLPPSQFSSLSLDSSSPVASNSTETCQRTSRHVFSPEELFTLKRVFQENPYPSTGQLKRLTEQMNISAKQARLWFKNQRAKKRIEQSSLTKQSPSTSIRLTPMQIEDEKLDEDRLSKSIIHLFNCSPHGIVKQQLNVPCDCEWISAEEEQKKFEEASGSRRQYAISLLEHFFGPVNENFKWATQPLNRKEWLLDAIKCRFPEGERLEKTNWRCYLSTAMRDMRIYHKKSSSL